MSTRAERKRRRNARRCMNCGEFGSHYYGGSAYLGLKGGFTCVAAPVPFTGRADE